MADKSEWKTPSMESEGKGDGHQYGRKPRTPEPIPIAAVGNSPSEEEMGHWTPTGIEPTDYDDDEYNTDIQTILSSFSFPGTPYRRVPPQKSPAFLSPTASLLHSSLPLSSQYTSTTH